MRSRFLSLPTSALALFVVFMPQGRAAAVRNRITSGINGNSRVALEHSVPARVRRSTDLGAASSDRTLTDLSLRFSMTPAQQADLTQLLSDQLNPSSPQYHKWLTPEQFGARFGLSAADIAKVSSWLSDQGFKVTGHARSSTFITFTGTVAQAEKAFGTSIHSLSYNGEQHISNMTDPTVPSAIADVLTTVTGLNDFKAKPHGLSKRAKLNPDYTYTSSAGTTSHFLAPGDFYTIYDMNSLLSSSTNGSGITIAVMGQTQLVPDRVAAFRTAAGLDPNNAPATQLYGASPGVVKGDIDEASLDVEWSGAAAPSAKILFVYSTDIFNGSLTQTIDNNLAPIVSISYGLCESLVSSSYNINSINQLLQQANAQGMTVIGAAGDGGATDCDAMGLASGGLAVDFPASSPFATAAGGTMFSGDVSNPGAYWNSSNSSNGTNQYTSSARNYIPEQTWNETDSTSGLNAGGAGGGGASAYFAKPAWQIGTAGVPSDGSRDLPDFALNAGAVHDGYIVCSQNDCTSGFQDSKNNIDVFGGTSVAAPTFAGMLAMVEQTLGGKRLGNVGPNLYGLANSTYYNNVFHDITSGNNAVACIQGTPNCATGNPIGFNAGPHYDQASGLGSIDAFNLVNDWTLATPVGVGGPATLSVTTLTASGALCGISSGSLALSVTVASGGTSTATPTGTVQFYLDSKAVGSPLPLTGGKASYTLNTSGLSSGQHNVNVVYSGDATFAGSKGSLLANASNTGLVSTIDVVSKTSPDFSITPCTATTSVASGAAASAVVLTITPTDGFTGPVKLAASSDTGDVLGYAFSTNPVVINSANSATTSFVLTATVTKTSGALKKPAAPFGSGRTPWYAAGSGATLACLVLFLVPRRRRWGALLAVLLSVAAVGAIGCGQNSVTVPSGGGGSSKAQPGTYNITVTATAGNNLVHSVVLTYNIQ